MNYIKLKYNHIFFIYNKDNDNSNSSNNNINKDKPNEYLYIIERGEVELNIDNRIYIIEKEGIISTKALIKHTMNNCCLKAKSKRVYIFQLPLGIYSALFKRYIEKHQEEKITILKKIYLFNGLNKETLLKIAEECTKEKILKKKFLIREDKMPKAIYFIIDGEVTCYKRNNIIRKVHKDFIFGEIPLFTQTESMYSYCACKDTELFKVKYDIINKVIGNGNSFVQVCLNNIFPIAVRNNRILRKYFYEEHYISFLFKLFRLKYYTHEQIASTKNKKIFIPLAGVAYVKTNQTNENYDTLLLLHGASPEQQQQQQQTDKPAVNNNNNYPNGEICGEDLLLDIEDEHNVMITKKVWSDECFTFELSWIDMLKTIQCSNLIDGNFYSSKSLAMQSLNAVNIMNVSTTSMLERMNYLRKVPYIKDICEIKLFRLAENLKIIFFKENEIIIRDGPSSDRLYIIIQGKAKLVINDIEVKILEPITHIGDITVDQSLYGQRASFYAKTNLTCYYLDKEVYQEIISMNAIHPIKNISPSIDISIKLPNLFYLKELGQGSYGKVYLVHDTKKKYALKSASVDMLRKNKEASQYYKEEKNILNTIDNPFIVKLINTFKTKQYIFLLMEYIEGHTLQKYMDVPLVFKTIRNVQKVTFITATLCIVLNYLQRKRIIHRDLKPGNLMLDHNGYVRVIDFGVAKDLTDKDSTSTFIGTVHYMAPEILKGKNYSFSVDIWAIGVIIYELFYGQLPYGIEMKNPQEVLKDIKERKVVLPFEPKNQNVNDVIKDLLHKNSSKRFNNFNRWKNWEMFRNFNLKLLLNCNMVSPLLEDDGTLPNVMYTHLDKNKRGNNNNNSNNNIMNGNVADLGNTTCPFHQFIKNSMIMSGNDIGIIDKKSRLSELFNDF